MGKNSEYDKDLIETHETFIDQMCEVIEDAIPTLAPFNDYPRIPEILNDYFEKHYTDIDNAYSVGLAQGRSDGAVDAFLFVDTIMIELGYSKEDSHKVRIAALSNWKRNGNKFPHE